MTKYHYIIATKYDRKINSLLPKSLRKSYFKFTGGERVEETEVKAVLFFILNIFTGQSPLIEMDSVEGYINSLLKAGIITRSDTGGYHNVKATHNRRTNEHYLQSIL